MPIKQTSPSPPPPFRHPPSSHHPHPKTKTTKTIKPPNRIVRAGGEMGALSGKNLNKSVTNHYKLDLLGFVWYLFEFLRAQRGVPSTRRARANNAVGCGMVVGVVLIIGVGGCPSELSVVWKFPRMHYKNYKNLNFLKFLLWGNLSLKPNAWRVGAHFVLTHM